MYHHFSGKYFIEELRLGGLQRKVTPSEFMFTENDKLKPSGRHPLGGLLTLWFLLSSFNPSYPLTSAYGFRGYCPFCSVQIQWPRFPATRAESAKWFFKPFEPVLCWIQGCARVPTVGSAIHVPPLNWLNNKKK